ncbi:MAG: hypothetical protein QNJ94_24220 [Alphaproteobacteria bacterium]|nr:hypothetical protein [Alphaproteobacteria bacterium]
MMGKDGRPIGWALAVLAALVSSSIGPAAAQTRKSTADMVDQCRTDALYCQETFAAYSRMFALTRLPELSHLQANRALAAKLNKRGDFNGICLPRERLWDEKFPDQLVEDFLRWYEANPDSAGQRAPASIKQAMQAIYPCQAQ